MILKRLSFVEFCQHALYLITFIGLIVSCYLFFMHDAIEKSKKEATTVTKRSANCPFEAPSITICITPPFKPSISGKYNLSQSIRQYFSPWAIHFDQGSDFGNKTVQKLFEEFSYSNDLTFSDLNGDLNLGKNKRTHEFYPAITCFWRPNKFELHFFVKIKGRCHK